MKYKRTNCLECNKEHGQTSFHTASHQRKHKRTLKEYLILYFECTNIDFNIKCLICNNECELIYEIDFLNKLYTKKFKGAKLCKDKKCKNEMSNKIFGNDYNPSQFSKIGSKKEYLVLHHNISLEEAKNMKYKETSEEKKITKKTNLDGYIIRYGEEEGLKKYKERCEKIGYSNTLPWYMDKYGIEEGKNKYLQYLDKLKQNTLGTTESKVSKNISKLLEGKNYKIEYEYPLDCGNKITRADFYLPDYNVIIEYYGDYWHMNPLVYESNFFHKTLKLTAEEIRERDKIRLNKIQEVNNIGILVIWEGFIVNLETIIKSIDIVSKNKNIIYLQGNSHKLNKYDRN